MSTLKLSGHEAPTKTGRHQDATARRLLKTALAAALVGVLAVLVNNLVSIIGVIINNAIALKKMRVELGHDRAKMAQQLNHDREQKQEDRRLTLRRDTYFGLAEHIRAGISAVTAWADPGLDHRELVARRQLSANFSAQIHLMAEAPLVAATVECNSAIDKAIVAVRIRRDRYLADHAKLIDLRGQIDSHRARGNAALESIRARHLAGPLPKEEVDRLGKVFEMEHAAANPLAVKHNAALETLGLARWELFQFARERENELYPYALKVVQAARHELGEPIDASVYASVLERVEENFANRDDARKLFGLSPSVDLDAKPAEAEQQP